MSNTYLEYVDTRNQDKNFIVEFPDYVNHPNFGKVVARNKSAVCKIGFSDINWYSPKDYKPDDTEKFIQLENIEAARLYHEYDESIFPAPALSLADNVKELKRKFDSRQINDEELKELAALISESITIAEVLGNRLIMDVYSSAIRQTLEFRES